MHRLACSPFCVVHGLHLPSIPAQNSVFRNRAVMQAAIASFTVPALVNSSHVRHVLKSPLRTSLFSDNRDSCRPFSPSPKKLSRKFICKPLAGKYLADDYLVKKLSAKEIQDLVRGERNVPLIVDFYATWCGPCILMAQVLETLAVEYQNKALIVKVDTDDEYEFARDMQVRGLPTVYFISSDPNKDAIRTEGLIPIEMMRSILENDM